MGTAVHLQTGDRTCFLGRTLDLAHSFQQAPLLLPRGLRYLSRASGVRETLRRAVLGMGTLLHGHPVLAEGMNESGLACICLGFPGCAQYAPDPAGGKTNLAPYDFLLWALSGHDTAAEAAAALHTLRLVDVPLDGKTPAPALHWMLADAGGNALVVEPAQEGCRVFSNPVGVLANEPDLPWHLTNWKAHSALSPQPPVWSRDPSVQGSGTLGLPGDFTSPARFLRAAYARAHLPPVHSGREGLTQVFHLLDYASLVPGAVGTPAGLEVATQYSCCMDLTRRVYYYRTCENSRVTAISLEPKGQERDFITVYPYCAGQDIRVME